MADIKDFEFKEEEAEEALRQFIPTNWPKPQKRWRLIHEIYNQSIEEFYFKALDFLQEEEEFVYFDKITDLFAASEQSAFFGASQQRLGLQQDRVSQFLATIGKMTKELFQVVRELRILDERLRMYVDSYKGDKPAEISLKGYWIDLVEGGAKNPASVYGMARELGFVTLPDLFFDAPVMGADHVDAHVNRLLFNKKVREVLKRKLKTFLYWKEETFKELKSRKIFTVRYLRQHYDSIRMYIQWVKPYLRNIKKLHMDQKKMDTPYLVSPFEGSMVELEVLARHPIIDGQLYACISLHFEYRTRPDMRFQQEGYQRGPIHVGRTQMTVRSYVWTPDDVRRYKEFRAKEDLDLLASINDSLRSAADALGGDLQKFIRQAGGTIGEDWYGPGKKPGDVKIPGLLDPFLAPFQGFGKGKKTIQVYCTSCAEKINHKDLFCKGCGKETRKPKKHEALALLDGRDKAESFLHDHMYNFIKRYKASYGMLY